MKQMKFLSLIMIATFAMSAQGAKAQVDCQGCEKVRAAQAKFRQLPSNVKQASLKLLEEASQSVANLRLSKTGELKPAQVDEFVELLEVSFPYDFGGYIIEGNSDLVRKNRKAIEERVKRLPENTALGILQAIRADQNSGDGNDFVD